MKRDNSGISGELDNHPLSAAYQGGKDEDERQGDGIPLLLGLVFFGVVLAIIIAGVVYFILPAVAEIMGL